MNTGESYKIVKVANYIFKTKMNLLFKGSTVENLSCDILKVYSLSRKRTTQILWC